MPMVRAMRLLNAIEAGTLSGAQLQTLLAADAGRLAELNVLLGMRGQARRMAASSTAMSAVIASSAAMSAVAASSTAMAAVNANDQATRIWMLAGTGLSYTGYASVSAVIASSTAMSAVAASSTAMSAVIASSTAMSAVAASSTAMSAVIASSTAMSAVAASSTAMSAVAASSTAMSAVFASSTARGAIHASTVAVDAIANTPSAIAWLRSNKLLSITSPAPDASIGAYQSVIGAPSKVLTLSIRNSSGTSTFIHTLSSKVAGSRDSSVAANNIAVEHVNSYSNLAWDTSYTSTSATYAAVIEYVDMT